MHATMAIFNAWCDRMPVLVLGATGPVDAPKRRPWIDWIHTARDQGALIRDYTKWDDQPASAEAARESLLRAVLDREYGAEGAGLHQSRRRHAGGTDRRSAAADRCRRASCPTWCRRVAPEQVARAVALLRAAKQPVILIGRGSRGEREWADRVALAETLRRPRDDRSEDAPRSSRPTIRCMSAHRRHSRRRRAAAIAAADVILSLDWVDLAGSAEGRVRHGLAGRQGDRGHARSSASQWLEHGPSGAAAGRSVHRRRCRYRGRGAAGAAAAAGTPRAPSRARRRRCRRPSQARSAWRR